MINYLKNKLYPDSLWNKILVVENEGRFTAQDVVAAIEREGKWKLTLDDILGCVGRACGGGIGQGDKGQEESESAAETARFTENMKPNI